MKSLDIISNLITPSGVTEYLYSVLPKDIPDAAVSLVTSFNTVDEFQLKILRVSLCILLINLFFIWCTWRKYGEKITERFMKPASSKSLEDLKREATELKLPKEHTPRI